MEVGVHLVSISDLVTNGFVAEVKDIRGFTSVLPTFLGFSVSCPECFIFLYIN